MEGEEEVEGVGVCTPEEEEEPALGDYSSLAYNIYVGYILVCISSSIAVDMRLPWQTWVAFRFVPCCTGVGTGCRVDKVGRVDMLVAVVQGVSGREQGA